MNKVSFLDKCLAKLNLSEDSKVGLAIDTIVKQYEKEIKAYERKISDLKAVEVETITDLQDKLAELIEEKIEIVQTIDVSKVKTSEDRKSYVALYTRKIRAAIEAVQNKEEEITNYKEDVAESVKDYQKQIELFKELLAEMD